MANMAVRANSAKHLKCRFAAKVQQLEALRTFAARRSTYFDARKHHHITCHGHHQSMDAIQKYARDLDPSIGQCLLTQSAAAAPSRILSTHPQLWIHAAQPLGLSRERQTSDRPLMRAKLLLRSTAYIIQTNVALAASRLGMLRNLAVLSAAGTALSPYYLSPSHAFWR
jgi:hypothetical protein